MRPPNGMLRRTCGSLARRGGPLPRTAAVAPPDDGVVGEGGGRRQWAARRSHSSSTSTPRYHPPPPPRRPPSSRSAPAGRRRGLASPSGPANSPEDARPPALFGLPDLVRPSDFLALAREAMRECDAVRRALASSLSSDDGGDSLPLSDAEKLRRARRTLHRLDDISNLVCSVIDAAELCRSVHASPEWRRGANDAFGMLSEYIGNLNADANLYRSLRRFVFCDDDAANRSADGFASAREDDENGNGSHAGGMGTGLLERMPPEYRRMAHAMRREFERDGIHLTYTKREEARELNNVIVGLESLFTNNITEKTKFYRVEGEAMVREVDRIVPRHVLGQLVRHPEGHAGDGEDRLTLSADNLLCNTLLAHSPSPELRKEVFVQSHTAVPENLDALDALVRHRHLHSSLLGYRSYAHRVLSDRMVGSPEKVQEFLSRMEERSKDVYRRDMESILAAKRHVEGSVGNGIEPWDVPFYAALIKAQRQHQRWKEGNASGSDHGGEESAQFAGYFSVENSIEGMKVLVRDMFGIAMEEAEIPVEERWDVDASAATSKQSAGEGGLRKFEFHHEEEGPLGTMYFDLHPRDGKFVHAAHFTIRCGRIRNDDDEGGQRDSGNSNEHQLPIVALVCNLSPSSGSAASQTLLSHSEVETLYHEFGHGLHSLLSRTSFQHLSGTRGAMDFVETPSHLFETFARDPKFLSAGVLARHHVTGLPMSEGKARHLALSHADLRAVEVRTQIVHSRFDQALFGPNPCSPSLGGATSTETWERLHRESDVPFAVGTHWHSRFGHLVTYGAGYYGYLYAQMFAADIWHGALSGAVGREGLREGGRRIWKEMLVHGGSKDPREMMRAVLRREPCVDPFFEGMS